MAQSIDMYSQYKYSENNIKTETENIIATQKKNTNHGNLLVFVTSVVAPANQQVSFANC